MNPPKKKRPRSGSKRMVARARTAPLVEVSAEMMARLRGLLGPVVTVTILPKVIDVDWEGGDSSTAMVLANTHKGLYPGDYVVWRNHTDVELVIEFTGGDWPFTGDVEDIVVPASGDSSAHRIADGASGTWGYSFTEYKGGPGGPTVTVPGG